MATTRFAEAPPLAASDLTRGLGRRLFWALPALFGAAYLAVLLVDFHQVIGGINTYGDAIIAPVLGKLAGQAPPGAHVLLGHHAYYEEYLFLRATAGLSFYRSLWNVAPLAWTLAGFGVLGWAAWRALGGFAALLTVSAVICLGNHGRLMFFSFNWHGLTVIHTILMAAALVWLAPRAARISWPAVVIAAVALGLISTLPAASDQLFPFWALVPLCLAAGLMGLRSEGRARWTPIVFALITTVIALAGGEVITQIMLANGVGASPFAYPAVARIGLMWHNLGLLGPGLAALGGGYIVGVTATVVGILVFISGLLVLIAVGVAVAEGWLLTARRPLRAPTRNTSSTTVGYVAFWFFSLSLQLVIFVVSGVPRETLGSSRYILAGYVAAMALMPLLARRGARWRAALTVAVCVFAASAIYQLAQRPFVQYSAYPTAPVAQRLMAFARAYHVHYGYAGYWVAPDVTWLTNFKLPIYPIRSDCGRLGICGLSVAKVSTWYDNKPGTRSMMIADSIQIHLHSLDPRLGRPLATTKIGTLTVAVYPFDIARDLTLGPTRNRSDGRRVRSRSA